MPKSGLVAPIYWSVVTPVLTRQTKQIITLKKERSNKMKKLSEIALLADLTISAWSGSIADKKQPMRSLTRKTREEIVAVS